MPASVEVGYYFLRDWKAKLGRQWEEWGGWERGEGLPVAR